MTIGTRDARKLPLPDRSVRALVLTHVLHHVPDLEAFFGEAQRVLVPGGVITMIEVAHTPFARFFLQKIFIPNRTSTSAASGASTSRIR
jgi:ubiquinone/menaquinone biosynthesis C-methylase UbiE